MRTLAIALGAALAFAALSPAVAADSSMKKMGGMHAKMAASAVSIKGFAFNPKSLTVAAGTTVVWTNNDKVAHTSTSDTGIWDSGHIQPGKTFSHTFATAGTFSYHCNIHPSMKGSIVVTAMKKSKM
jgi:plastocyanin